MERSRKKSDLYLEEKSINRNRSPPPAKKIETWNK